MDISAANASAPQPDLLGLASPPAELPNPNRFELASPRPSEEQSGIMSPESPSATKPGQIRFTHDSRPASHNRNRMSYDGPSRPTYPRRDQRRFSFGSRQRGNSLMYDDDDLEGDLGYAAAEGMEGNQRKVIVERLETVKSKNPVFTWC